MSQFIAEAAGEDGVVVHTNRDYAAIIAVVSPSEDGLVGPSETELAIMLTNEAATQYQRDRQSLYPSLQDQADMQYHDAVSGTTTWLDTITAIKLANPKP